MKHAWLCIDPGITTGWALLADDGSVLGTSVLGTGELRDTLDVLVRRIFSSGYSITAVIELMPNTGAMGQLGQQLERVRRDVMMIVSETYEIPIFHIAPGEWKPSRVAKLTRVPAKWQGRALETHQKDAIRMGRYAQDKYPRKVAA